MRIERLDLIAYGHLRGQTLDLSHPSPGLTLVVGPNEAGKSTAMRAITALFFGVDRGTTDDHHMGREGLKIGAAVAAAGGQSLEIVRQGLSRAPLVASNGQFVDEGVLAAMLGGISRSLFTALFCIDHDELHERSEDLLDPNAEIGRLIFGASLGATALTDVLKNLDVRGDELYRPNGSKQHVAVSLTRARGLAKQARNIRVRSREWEEADRALEQLGKDAQGLRDELVGLRADEDWLKRQTAALPQVAKRSQLRDQIAEIERSGPVQPHAWGEAVEVARQALATAGVDRERAIRARDAIRIRLDDMPESSPLLIAGGRIDTVVEDLGRYRKGVSDSPGLRGELTASRSVLAELLERLGMKESAARAVTDARLAVVEELAQTQASLDAREVSVQQELEELRERIKHDEHALQDLPEATDSGKFEQVVAVARTFIDRERQMPNEQAKLDALAGDIRAGAKRLGLSADDFDALEQLQTPESSTLRRHRDQLQALRERRSTLEQRVEETNSRGHDLESRQAAILADSSVPSPDAVTVARERRDEGWSLVRAAWIDNRRDDAAIQAWAGDEALESAFEVSVGEADDRADNRFDHATQVANLAQIETELAEVAAKQRGFESEQAELDEEVTQLDDAWSQLWAATEKRPDTVDEAEEWLAGVAEVQRIASDLRTKSSALEAARIDVESQRDAVLQYMSDCGAASESRTLALAVQQAEALIADAHQTAELRGASLHAIKQAKRDVPRRKQAVEAARTALVTWQDQWSEALAPLGLDPSTTPAAGREATKLLRNYRGERVKAETLRGRVDGLQKDINDYKATVEALALEVAPELAEFEPIRAVTELKPELDEARKESRVRAELLSQAEGAEKGLRQAEEAVQQAHDDLDRLRGEASLDNAADLPQEAQRAAAYAELSERLGEIDDTLVSQGGGRTLKELLDALDGTGVGEGELQAQLDGVNSEIARVDEALETVNRQYGDATAKLASLDHGGQAVILDQDAELEFATLAGYVSEYAQVAIADAILRRVVADYGQENRGPILKLAGHNFSVLTDGAFTGLLVDLDGDRQVLLAQRQNGELLHVEELSEGTVDQLYLALRLAGIEHHLGTGEHQPPVVLDDLLVNFDDGRATAALRLFAELGQKAQVLLFTHHRHIRDLAENALGPGVVHIAELAPRDHAAPVEAPLVTLVRGRSRESVRIASHEASEAAILEALRKADDPLGKAEILARTGVADSAWTTTIRSLVERGVVVQEGAKRGARYSLKQGG